MRLLKALERMRPAVRERFESVWSLLTRPEFPDGADREPRASQFFAAADADVLVRDVIFCSVAISFLFLIVLLVSTRESIN